MLWSMYPAIFRKRILLAAAAALVILLLAGCGAGRSNESKSAAKQPAAVQAVQAQLHPITRKLEVVGTLFPEEQVVVSSQVEGQVLKVHVDVGDRVSAGQVMVSLDTEELRYQMERQAANLQRTMARLGLNDERGQVKDVMQVPDVKKAAAELQDAEQKFNRARDLHRQELVARQDLDAADARYRSAKAAYEVAVQQVRTLEAEFRSQRADLEIARKKLRDAEIRAPFDAFVQERQVAPGQYLRVQTPVMTMVKPNPLRLRADIPERMTNWVRNGQAIEARTEAMPDRVFHGRISRITPQVKEQTRSFAVEALINNSELLLKPGLFVRATVATTKVDQVLLVPEAALKYAFGIYRLLVIQNGTLVGREVKLGDRFEQRVEIAEGAKAGEWVALHPERLQEGAAVTMQKTGAEAAIAAEPAVPGTAKGQ